MIELDQAPDSCRRRRVDNAKKVTRAKIGKSPKEEVRTSAAAEAKEIKSEPDPIPASDSESEAAVSAPPDARLEKKEADL